MQGQLYLHIVIIITKFSTPKFKYISNQTLGFRFANPMVDQSNADPVI